MTKGEYLSKREELFRQLNALKEEYIKTNSPIPSGTKVKIYRFADKVEYGILLGYTCSFDDVEPKVAKICKDGTPHARERIYVGTKKIEVA